MGLLGGIGKAIGGIGKGLGKGLGGGLLKNGLGGLGKGLGKALEAVGGPQGIMDMVNQFAGGGGAEEAGGAGEAGGAQQAKGGEAKADENNPLVKMAKTFAKAKSPKDVDKIVKKLQKKLKGKMTPELKELVNKVAEAKKASLKAGAVAA